MPLNDDIQKGFIAAGEFFPSVHDKGGVRLGPVADGFKKSAKRLNADDLDTDFLLVFSGQLVDPAAEAEITLFEVLRIFVEVPPISLSPQTHLVCHAYVVLSVKVRQGNEREYLYRDGFHVLTPRGTGKPQKAFPFLLPQVFAYSVSPSGAAAAGAPPATNRVIAP